MSATNERLKILQKSINSLKAEGTRCSLSALTLEKRYTTAWLRQAFQLIIYRERCQRRFRELSNASYFRDSSTRLRDFLFFHLSVCNLFALQFLKQNL